MPRTLFLSLLDLVHAYVLESVVGGGWFSVLILLNCTCATNGPLELLSRAHHRRSVEMKFAAVVAALLAGSAASFAPGPVASTRAMTTTNMAAADEFYIDEERRFTMNLILLGSAAVTVGGLAVPYVLFFYPPGAGGGGGGVTAKDALGNDLLAKEYLASKPALDRSLAQGLKGDAT